MPPFFPMPLFGDITLLLTAVGTGILCLILGYLVGYFTTHRSQSDYLGAQQQLANLQGQNFRQQATSIGIPLGDSSVVALPPRKTKTDSSQPTFPAANDARLAELQRLSDGLVSRNEQLVKELREERRTRSELELAASRSPAVDSLTDTDWQIGKLNQEVIGLQQRLDSKQDEIDGLTSQRDTAELARRAAAQSLDELRGLLGQGEAAVASLEREKSDLRNQVNDLQTRLALAEDPGDSQSMEEERNSLRGTIETLKQNLDQRDLAILSMERELSNLRIARDRVASLEISIAERNNFAERLSQQLVAAAADRKAITARFDELNREFKSRDETLESVKGELDAARRRADDLEQETRNSASTQARLEELVTELRTREGELSAERQKLLDDSNELESVRSRFEQLQESHRQLLAEHDDAQSAISDLTGRVGNMVGEIQQMTLTADEARALKEQRDDLEQTVREYEHSQTQLQRNLVEITGRAEELSVTIRDFALDREELALIRRQNIDLLERLGTQEAESKEQAKKNARLIERLQELQAKVAELEAAVAAGDVSRQLQEAESSSAAEELRKNELLTAKIRDLEVQLFQLKAEFSEVSQLRQRVAELDSNAHLSAASLAESQELISRLTAELHENVELSQGEADPRQQLEDARLRIDQLDAECRGLQARAESAEHVSAESRTEINNLSETIRILENEHGSLTDRLEAASQREDSIRSQLGASEQTILELRSVTDRFPALQTEKDELELQLSRLQGQFDQAVSERGQLQSAREESERAVQELRAELERLSGQHPEQVVMSVDDQQAMNDRLVEVASQVEARTAELELRTSELAAARAANSEFSDRLAEADAEQVLLTTELHAIRAEAEKLSAALEHKSQERTESDVDTIRELGEKYKAAVERASRAERELTDSRNELYRQSEAANNWRQERAELLDQLEQMEQNHKQLAETVAQSPDRESEANVDPNVERLIKHNQDLESERLEVQTRVDKQKSQLRDVAAALSAARREVASLRSELSEAQAIHLTSQSPRLSGAATSDATLPSKKNRSAKPKSQTPNDDASANKKSAKSNRNGGSRAAKHPLLGKVYSQTPKEMDDLREIKGLGPAFEKRLHELGIFQFSQIVKWKSSVTAEIAKLLGTNDRTVSAWIEEAGKLSRGRST